MDSGSINKLVAKEIVHKLGLKRERNPCPFRIGWLQDDHALEVREQCLVEFKFGKYKDQVLCDIVEMSSHHIFLGRPWYYDCGVVHDCFKNLYV